MPQLDFLIYSYQFILLFIVFFLLYDLFLNFWLPAFLSCMYFSSRYTTKIVLLSFYLNATSSIERRFYITQFRKFIR